MKQKWLLLLSSIFLFPITAWSSPILQFNFNDPGSVTSTMSTGTDPATINFENTASAPSNAMLSPAGTGVGGDIPGNPGFGTDRAFDPNSNPGIAINSTDTSLSGLKSWTVSGWYKSPAPLSGGGKVIFNSALGNSFLGSSGYGFYVRIENGTGNLRTTVYANSSETKGLWTDTNKWVFFAITYDGTATSGNLNYYRGYRNSIEAASNSVQVSLVDSLTLNSGAVNPSPAGFSIGNIFFGGTVSASNYFPGMLDDLRVDGSLTDNSGADSTSTLESYRAADVVPEPSMGAALLLGTTAALGLRRRGKSACKRS